MIRQSKTAALTTPTMDVLEAFNVEFYGRDSSLVGSSEKLYESDESNTRDLVQLHCTERRDRVSAFLAKRMFRWLQVSSQIEDEALNCPTKTTTQTKQSNSQAHTDPQIVYLYTARLDLAVELFYTLLSIGLLLGAILSLYFVESALWRIGIIVLFTLLFAACAVFLADGRRLAVFGACAAYAAVLVVFVSSSTTPGPNLSTASPLAPG
jgi:hypothetical protein